MPLSTLARRSSHASKRWSFFVGLGQMIFMAANIRNIANGHLVFLFPFTITNTYVWVHLVRVAMHSTKGEVFFYALGSAVGACLGVTVSHYFIEPNAFTHLAGLIANLQV